MTNPNIAIRQNMKKESSDELVDLQRHHLLLITIGIITPQKGDLCVLDTEDAIIADGDSVGISAQILKDSLSSVEWRLAVYDPLLMIEPSSEYLKVMRLSEMTDPAGEDKIIKAVFEMVQKLASEQR
jgi:hypothetical protein